MPIPFLAPLVDILDNVVDKVIVDKNQREQIKFEIEKLKAEADSRDFQLQMGQIETNKIEAASTNWFVAGWRPFIGWTAGGGVAWTFVVGPFVEFVARLFGWTGTMPVLDTGQLMVLVTSMLGLGAMRSWEKARGLDLSVKKSDGTPVSIQEVTENTITDRTETLKQEQQKPRRRRIFNRF